MNTNIYIYIYIYVCVCVCVYIYIISFSSSKYEKRSETKVIEKIKTHILGLIIFFSKIISFMRQCGNIL